MSAYHEDCKVFDFEGNKRIGLFIGDYYARKVKSGAWCCLEISK